MKKIIRSILPVLAASLFAMGCEKEENQIVHLGGVAPVLTGSSATPILKPGEEANHALTLSWTNPNYTFSTGLSSHDVQYKLEIDTAGVNFTSKSKGTIAISRDLEKVFTVNDLNVLLSGAANMNLTPDRFYNFEARVTSSIGSANGLPLTSNVFKFTAKPFSPPPAVPVPDAGTLWATGDAFPSGWANPLGAPYDTKQKFTRVSNTLYELTVDMPGGGAYKLIQTNGVWGTQYRMLEGGTWQGGGFKKQDADPGFQGPPTAGKYKITVNFQTGKFSAVKL